MTQNDFEQKFLETLSHKMLLDFVKEKTIESDQQWLLAITRSQFVSACWLTDSDGTAKEFEMDVEAWCECASAAMSILSTSSFERVDNFFGDPEKHVWNERLLALHTPFSFTFEQRVYHEFLMIALSEEIANIRKDRRHQNSNANKCQLDTVVAQMIVVCAIFGLSDLLTHLLNTEKSALEWPIDNAIFGGSGFAHCAIKFPACTVSGIAVQFSMPEFYDAIQHARVNKTPPVLLHGCDEVTDDREVTFLDNVASKVFPFTCTPEHFVHFLEWQIASGAKDYKRKLGQIFKSSNAWTFDHFARHLVANHWFDKPTPNALKHAIVMGHHSAIASMALPSESQTRALFSKKTNPVIAALKAMGDDGIKDRIEKTEPEFEKTVLLLNHKLRNAGLSELTSAAFVDPSNRRVQPLCAMLESGSQTILKDLLAHGLDPFKPMGEGQPTPIEFVEGLTVPNKEKTAHLLRAWVARSVSHNLLDDMENEMAASKLQNPAFSTQWRYDASPFIAA